MDLSDLVDLIFLIVGLSLDIASDLRQNRNDRGRFKRPSAKYAC